MLNIFEDHEYAKQISILSTLSKKRRVNHRYILFEDRGMPSSFRKAGFVINEQDTEEMLEVKEEDVNELNQMFERLGAAEETKGNLIDFLSADNDLATNQPMTLEEIAEANSQVEVGVPEPEEAAEIEVEIVEEEQPVSVLDALNGFKVLQRYMKSHEVYPAMLRMCDKIDDFLAKERTNKLKQNPITNFFRPLL
uniref:Uncharacterized protein n=1 Tax=Ditylenchus dipsaci TaxID=166011 RepID=A0A915EMZ1_9BILA